uniref:Uncharacterized protein n=1 Tax=Anguilla anguilla TaxID=7936 RepID=A0A0E9RUG2_ANGAN
MCAGNRPALFAEKLNLSMKVSLPLLLYISVKWIFVIRTLMRYDPHHRCTWTPGRLKEFAGLVNVQGKKAMDFILLHFRQL